MIGIMADTHENEEATKKALEIFKQKNVEFIVHCGDIISPIMLEHFQGFKMKFVFGNNDGEKKGLNKMAKQFGFEEITDKKEFECNGKKFYVYHGTRPKLIEAAIQSNKYDYVLTAHTHVKRDERIGKTRVINPGALFRAYPYTIALLDADKDKLDFIEITRN